MKISGAEDQPQSSVLAGRVEKGHVVMGSHTGTEGGST